MWRVCFWENLFWAIIVQKGSKIRYTTIFQKFCNLIFLKIVQNESSYNFWVFIGNPVYGDINFEFWPKNISTYQNIGFFKLYFMNDLKHEDEFLNIPQTKTKSDFIVRSVETGSGRWMLVVVVISVDAYPFLAFSDLTCYHEATGIVVFWLHCATW